MSVLCGSQGRNVEEWGRLPGTRVMIANFAERMVANIDLIENRSFRDTLAPTLERENLPPHVPLDGPGITLGNRMYSIPVLKRAMERCSMCYVDGAFGVFAHPSLAIEFAESISPEFASVVKILASDMVSKGVIAAQRAEKEKVEEQLAIVKHKLQITERQVITAREETVKAEEETAIANHKLQLEKEQLVIANRQTDVVKTQLFLLQRENEQLAVLRRDKAKVDEEFKLVTAERDAALKLVPHQVTEELRQHVILVCHDENVHYSIHHGHMAYLKQEFGTMKWVAICEDVPCGTKVVNVMRDQLDRMKCSMVYSKIMIHRSKLGTRRNLRFVPRIVEQELIDILKGIVADKVAMRG